MIDKQGYRPNIGIIICNDAGQVLWAKRVHQNAWQFPQGGMDENERPEQALFRELEEEVGLKQHQVKILGRTKHWLRYRLPKHMQRKNQKHVCIGQKQIWYLLKLLDSDDSINLNNMKKPEFDGWQWVSYWFPLSEVIAFKRDVYRRAMLELSPYMAKLQRNNSQGNNPQSHKTG